VLHDSACVTLPYSVFLVQQPEWTLRKGKELSQIPMSRTATLIGVRTSKLNRSSVRVEMIISWTIEQGRYMKSWWDRSDMAQKATMLLWVLDWPWWLTCAIWSRGGIQEDTCEDTSIPIRTNIYLDNSDRMVLEVTCEINMTRLKGGLTPCWVLAWNQWQKSTNRAKE
jgi:hypothetical protein